MLQPILSGVVGSITGFAGSFALVIAGLVAVGATERQAASGLLVLSLMSGVLAIGVSLATRSPMSFAWSTPGAAALIAAGVPDGGFSAAVGAFLVSSALMVAVGLLPPLERVILAIPAPIAAAMLAGVLLPICLTPALVAPEHPWVIVPMVLVWLVFSRFAARWAAPAAMLVAIVGIVIEAGPDALSGVNLSPVLEVVTPSWSLSAIIGIALPLFVVTMAGQNLPGFAVLRLYNYPPRVPTVMVSSGLGSVLSAFLGGHALNLTAITAALMAGPSASADPGKRWIASVANGISYIVLAGATGLIAAVVAAAPPDVIIAAAGLALIGALTSSLVAALESPPLRLSALVTFLVTVSGLSLGGVGSAFWGLLAGLVVFAAFGRNARA